MVRTHSKNQPAAPSANSRSCAFPGCWNPHHAKGYCKKCYSQLRRVGEKKFARLIAEAAESSGGAPTGPMSKEARLALIKKRYEVRKKEIEAIRKSLETED